MLLGQLRAEIVQDDETFEEALDREARAIVRDSRADQYLPLLDHLVGFDLGDYPYAQILVGLIANSRPPKDRDLVFTLLDAAASTFLERADVEGQVLSWWVRGNVLLGVGDVGGAARAWKRSIDLDPTTDLIEDLALANLAYGSFCLDGDVDVALNLASAAIASSRERNHARGEGLGLVYAGYLHIHGGRFEQAQRSFELADDAFGSEDEPPYEWPLAFAGLGALAGIRGLATEADQAFLRGILLARQMENPWYEAIVRALRADHTMQADSRRAHADCRFAQRVFDDFGDQWWAVITRRVRADAALASGETEAARLVAEQLLSRIENPVERSRCLITAGRAHLLAGDVDAAARRADEAVRGLDGTGAAFVLVQALLLLAEAAPWRAPEAIEEARTLSTDDRAFAQLWAARPTLRVRALGRQSISVGTCEARFRTSRAEHLVLMLALAGGRGVEVEQVADALWPGGDLDKLPSNLSTATYDARQGLGSEAWRLHRSGSQFWLDLDGATVDVHDAMRRARGIRPLDEPGPEDKAEAEAERLVAVDLLRNDLLPTLTFEPWVVDANERRLAFLDLLGVDRSRPVDWATTGTPARGPDLPIVHRDGLIGA